MAAILTIALPLIEEALPFLVRWMEHLFPAEKQGPVKQSTLLSLLQEIVGALGTAGIAQPPNDAALVDIIQKTVNELNAQGQLLRAQTDLAGSPALDGLKLLLEGAIGMIAAAK